MSTGRDHMARVWNAKTGTEILALKGHKNFVNHASYSPDGTRIVTAGFDHTARMWDAKTGTELFTLRGHIGAYLSARFSQDGSRVVTSGYDNTVCIWDASGSAEGLTIRADAGRVETAAFSLDGARVVTGGDDKTARVWDARTGARASGPQGSHRGHHVRSVQPRRCTGCDWEPGQHGQGVGRPDRRRVAHPPGAHRRQQTLAF